MDAASQRSIAFAVRVANKLRTLGWTVTPMQDPFCSGIIAESGRERLIARCRFQVSAVELEAVQDVLATAPRYRPCRMLVVAQSNYYTDEAREVAGDSGVILVTLRELDARSTWDRRRPAQSAQTEQSASGPTEATSQTRAEQAAHQRAEAAREAQAEQTFREEMARFAADLMANRDAATGKKRATRKRVVVRIMLLFALLIVGRMYLRNGSPLASDSGGQSQQLSAGASSTGVAFLVVPSSPSSSEANAATERAVKNNTAALSASQRAAIGAYVRRCWAYHPRALNADKMQVMLLVTTDADGVARIIHFAPADRARMDADPMLRRFAARARSAVFDPRCAKLPLPHDMLGKINVLTFRFSP